VTFEPTPSLVPTSVAGGTSPIEWLPEAGDREVDPAAVLLTCANCGAPMDERKCICGCGYFLSCSDYY
jgi:hypothetical protein